MIFWFFMMALYVFLHNVFPVLSAAVWMGCLKGASCINTPALLSPQLLCKDPTNRLRHLDRFRSQNFFHGTSFDPLLLQKAPVEAVLRLRNHLDRQAKARDSRRRLRISSPTLIVIGSWGLPPAPPPPAWWTCLLPWPTWTRTSQVNRLVERETIRTLDSGHGGLPSGTPVSPPFSGLSSSIIIILWFSCCDRLPGST